MLVLKIILICFIIFSINFATKKSFKFYQLSHYNIFSIFTKDFFKKNLAIFVLSSFFALSKIFSTEFYIFFILIIIQNLLLIFFNKKEKNEKNKLVFTKRFSRFFVIFNLLNISCLTMIFFAIKSAVLAQIFAIFYQLFAYFLLIFTHFFVLPLEKLINLFYISLAQKKLKNSPKTQIIAITGSFGKTSVKNILCEMLKTKFSVIKTKSSFNTPMGITKTILNEFSKNCNHNCDFLILEFGADHIHDIKKLCSYFPPNHSIITGVTNQHLKTFKTMENIISTKFELVLSTKKDGFVVFNGTNEISHTFFEKDTHKNKILVGNHPQKGKNFAQIYAKNIKTSFLNTSFTLYFGEKEFKLKTDLLGEFSVTNILLCANLALNLGVEIDKIAYAIENLIPTENRLKLIKISNNKFILDDSFNSNILGAKEALCVLEKFWGTKIVVTPGLVELGEIQDTENEKLGKLLAKFDYVLITNRTNFFSLEKGIKNELKKNLKSKFKKKSKNDNYFVNDNNINNENGNDCIDNSSHINDWNILYNDNITNYNNECNKNHNKNEYTCIKNNYCDDKDKRCDDKIIFCENLEIAKEKLSKIFVENCCVLFLNDLPDNYD